MYHRLSPGGDDMRRNCFSRLDLIAGILVATVRSGRTRFPHVRVARALAASVLVAIAVVGSDAAWAGPLPAANDKSSVQTAPPRGEGDGPYTQLILRGVIVIDGTGAPAYGPADVVIEGNRIVQVEAVGNPGAPIKASKRPKLKQGGREIDLAGQYVMPGIIDMHGHIGGGEQGVPAEYVYKLWMGNGITTVREPGCLNGVDWCLGEYRRSLANAITAPRIFPYAVFGAGREAPMTTPEEGRQWVRDMKAKGILGMKCFGYRPDVLEAAFDELKKQGMRSACHHSQTDVARVNALTTARWGLTSMEHWYGLPEALFDDRTVQNYPPAYNYNNEADRFGQAGRLWAQAAQKGSDKYEAVIAELLKLDFTIDPTFTIYAASRDLMRARRADWHDEYTLPQLWDYFTPNRDHHGSFFFDWGTEDEVALASELHALDGVRQRLQESRRQGYGRLRLGLHLPDLRLRHDPGTRTAARGGLPSARSDPLGDALRRAGAGRAESPGLGRTGQARRPRRARGEPARESQGALRHGPYPPRRRWQDAARRRRQVHDQGRYRLRREEAACRRAQDGGGRKGEARHQRVAAAVRACRRPAFSFSRELVRLVLPLLPSIP